MDGESGQRASVRSEIVRDLCQFPTYAQLRQAFFAPLGASEGVRAECTAAWKEYCYNKDFPVYECWNCDYIDQLALYLIDRKKHYAPDEEIRVLEAGAGTGKLTFGLQQALTRLQGDGITIDAVDNSERPMKRLFPVVRGVDCREALNDQDYTIVLCAWMPFGTDWTSDFRKKASVKEYILIGHTGDGLNGDPLLTWGYRKFTHQGEGEYEEEEDDDDYEVEGYIDEKEREYVKGGFERVDLPHLSRWQLCRFDNVDSRSGQPAPTLLRNGQLTNYVLPAPTAMKCLNECKDSDLPAMTDLLAWPYCLEPRVGRLPTTAHGLGPKSQTSDLIAVDALPNKCSLF